MIRKRLYLMRHAQSENNLNESNNRKSNDLDETLNLSDKLSGTVLQNTYKRKNDPDITNHGIIQAIEVANWIQENIQSSPRVPQAQKIAKIYCSPMLRSIQTTKLVNSVLKISYVEVKEFLHEEGGIFDGLRGDRKHENVNDEVPRELQKNLKPVYKGSCLSHLMSLLPDAQFPQKWSTLPKDGGWWTSDKEKFSDCVNRAKSVVDWLWNLLKENDPSSVLIISHGIFMDILIKLLINHPIVLRCKKEELPDEVDIFNFPLYFMMGCCSLSTLDLYSDNHKFDNSTTSQKKKKDSVLDQFHPIEYDTHDKDKVVRSSNTDQYHIYMPGSIESSKIEDSKTPFILQDDVTQKRTVSIISWNQTICSQKNYTGQSLGSDPRVSTIY